MNEIKVNQTEIDGVRCFWVDSGRPTLNASLLFRAGLVDEDFTTHGWHHLLEHSALHGRGGGALSINGSVSLTTTTFDAHGPAERVAAHFADLSSWLSSPDLTDLTRETGVLKAEQATRGWNAVADALVWRYGSRGPGLAATDEYGLSTVTPEALVHLATTSFTTDNAVLALDGPPPAGFRITLPHGPGDGPRPLPVAEPVETGFPGLYTTRGVVISGTTARSWAATLLAATLESRLRKRFRDRDGAAYAPWSTYERMDDNRALILAGSDVTDVIAGEVAIAAADIVARTVDFGAEHEDFRDLVDQITQGMRDPYNAAGFAWRAAQRALGRDEILRPEDDVERVQALKPDDLCEPAAELAQTVLIGAPDRAVTPSGYRKVERPVAPARPGRRFRSRNWPADRSVLIVDDGGVTAKTSTISIGVRFDDLVGMIRHRDAVRDLVAVDSWNLTIHADDWHESPALIGLIDSRVDQRVHVASLSDQYVEPTRRMSWMRRWWGGFLNVLGARDGTVAGLFLAVPIAAVLFGAAAATHLGVLAVVGVILLGQSIFYFARGRAPEEKPAKQLPPDLRRFS